MALMNITTQLQLAVMDYDTTQDEIQELIKQGADIHYNNDEALRNAAGYGYTETVKTLLEHGADVNAKDGYPLRAASKEGKIEVVKVLLAHKADVHASNDESLTLAAKHGHKEVVKVLLEHGADIHARYDGALKFAAREKKQDVVNLLVIDYNMPISQDTMDYLKQMNLQETIDTINKRDLNIKLNSNLKQKKEKSFTIKI